MPKNKRGPDENPTLGHNAKSLDLHSQGIVDSVGDDIGRVLSKSTSITSYVFAFQSGISGLSDADKEIIREYLCDNESKNRVYCIRHGKSVQEEEFDMLSDEEKRNNPLLQDDDALFSESARMQYEWIAEEFKKMGIRNENSYIFCCFESRDGTVIRIQQSCEILAEKIGIESSRVNNVSGLDTTDKTDKIMSRRTALTETHTADFIAQLQERLGKGDIENVNIICVIHKSNIDGINKTFFGHSLSHLPNSKGIQTGEIAVIDLNGAGKAMNYRQQKESLGLDFYNHKKIIQELSGEVGLRNVIQSYERQEIQILELQSFINAYFEKERRLFVEYLDSENLDLRIFCLANLLKHKEYTPIGTYYLNQCKTLAAREKELLLKNIHDPKIKSLLRKLFITKEDLWKKEESELFSQEQQSDFYNLLRQSRIAYKEALAVQWHSLDPLISKAKENAILDRSLCYEKEEDVEEENPKWTKVWNKKKVLVRKAFHPDFFQKWGEYSRFILRAHVGEWKSMYLSELSKQISLNSDRKVKFVTAKNIKNINELFDDTDALVCIDALDEAGEDMKMAIKEKLKTFEGQCIMTTRYSEAFDFDTKTCMLSFDPIESDIYIDSRFPENPEKAAEVKDWLQKQWLANEIKGNPLLLNLIVLLASATDEEKKWMKKFNVLSLDQIRTKSDLYESVVRFVLAKHSKEDKEQRCTSKDLNRWMDDLWEHAHRMFSSLDDQELSPDDIEDFNAHLSILFKSEKDGSYDFIHKSFYEFFLWRHSFGNGNGTFPHTIGAEAKKFYADFLEKGGGDPLYVNAARNFRKWFEFILDYGIMRHPLTEEKTNELIRVLEWKPLDPKMVEFYKKEFVHQDTAYISRMTKGGNKLVKPYVLYFLEHIRNDPDSDSWEFTIARDMDMSIPDIIIQCIENGWIGCGAETIHALFGDDVEERSKNIAWMPYLLTKTLCLINRGYFDGGARTRLLQAARKLVGSKKQEELDSFKRNQLRLLCCSQAQAGDEMSIEMILDPDFHLQFHETMLLKYSKDERLQELVFVATSKILLQYKDRDILRNRLEEINNELKAMRLELRDILISDMVCSRKISNKDESSQVEFIKEQGDFIERKIRGLYLEQDRVLTDIQEIQSFLERSYFDSWDIWMAHLALLENGYNKEKISALVDGMIATKDKTGQFCHLYLQEILHDVQKAEKYLWLERLKKIF